MKKLLTILALTLAGTIHAQEAIGFQATQDVTFQGQNMVFKALLQGNESKLGYVVVAPSFHLSDDVMRYGVDIGYAFHTGMYGIDFTPSIGSGQTIMDGVNFANIEFSGSLKIPVLKNISAVILMSYLSDECTLGVGLRYDVRTLGR